MLLTIIKALEVDFRNADNERYLHSNTNISQNLSRILAVRKHYPEFHAAQTSMFPKLSALSKLTRAEGLCLSYWHDCSEISEFKSALGHRSEIDEAAVLAARPSRFKVASLSRYMQRNEDVVLLRFLSDVAKTNKVRVDRKVFTTQEDRQQITGMLYNLHLLEEQLHSMISRQVPKLDFAPTNEVPVQTARDNSVRFTNNDAPRLRSGITPGLTGESMPGLTRESMPGLTPRSTSHATPRLTRDSTQQSTREDTLRLTSESSSRLTYEDTLKLTRDDTFRSNHSEPHNAAQHNRDTRYAAPLDLQKYNVMPAKSSIGMNASRYAPPAVNPPTVNPPYFPGTANVGPKITPVRSRNQITNLTASPASNKSNFFAPISFDNGPISQSQQTISGAYRTVIDSSGPVDIWYSLAEDPRTPHRFLEWLSENNNEYVAQRALATLKKQELDRMTVQQLPQRQPVSSQIFAS
ncbi:MAG TPA: hypothetical protein V6C76_10405 [Drouetiella sp.]